MLISQLMDQAYLGGFELWVSTKWDCWALLCHSSFNYATEISKPLVILSKHSHSLNRFTFFQANEITLIWHNISVKLYTLNCPLAWQALWLQDKFSILELFLQLLLLFDGLAKIQLIKWKLHKAWIILLRVYFVIVGSTLAF